MSRIGLFVWLSLTVASVPVFARGKHKPELCAIREVSIDIAFAGARNPAMFTAWMTRQVEATTWLKVVPEGTPNAGTLLLVKGQAGPTYSEVYTDPTLPRASGRSGQDVPFTLALHGPSGKTLWEKMALGFEGIVSDEYLTGGAAYEQVATPSPLLDKLLRSLAKTASCSRVRRRR